MTIIILLIAISLTIAVVFLVIFIWNVKTGQYDDTYTPSVRILFESKPKKSSKQLPKKIQGLEATKQTQETV